MSDLKVISSVVNPLDNKTLTLAEGSIERIVIKRINEDGSPKVTPITKGPNKGKSIVATHKASMLLKNGEDEVWINFGTHEVKNLNYENKYQIKEGEVWVDLKPGMIIRLPVNLREWKTESGEVRQSYEGKKTKIIITDKSGARDVNTPAPSSSSSTGSQSTSGASNGSGAKTTKVYGEIVSLEGLEATVKAEDGTEVSVTLSQEQVSQIQKGGRMTGMRSGEGKIVSGFKAYGPKGSSGGKGSSAGGKRDNTGVETGHAINGALILRRRGFNGPSAVEVSFVVHDVTKQLKHDFANDESTRGMSEYDIGAMVGHAVLNATRDVDFSSVNSPEALQAALIAEAKATLINIVPQVSVYIKGSNPGVAEEKQKETPKQDSKPEPDLSSKNQGEAQADDNGHIDMSPDDYDFDMDIPF